MQRFREGIHIRTMKAKRKVEEISKEDIQAFLKKNAFVLFTVGAVVVGVYASTKNAKWKCHETHTHNTQTHAVLLSAGIVLGFALRPYKMTYREVKYFSFPGELLMRMLQMLVLPLLISSLITGTKYHTLCHKCNYVDCRWIPNSITFVLFCICFDSFSF